MLGEVFICSICVWRISPYLRTKWQIAVVHFSTVLWRPWSSFSGDRACTRVMSSGLKKAQQAASSIADTIAGALSFQKSLTDLVRGIRNNKGSESAYISQCISEIKQELRNEDKKVKMIAVQKLTYVRVLLPSSRFSPLSPYPTYTLVLPLPSLCFVILLSLTPHVILLLLLSLTIATNERLRHVLGCLFRD